MKKIWLRLVALLCLVAMVCLSTGCDLLNVFKSDEQLIRERIEEFSDCYNNGDMDGVLECLDSRSRNIVEATLNISGGLIGGLVGIDVDISDLFALSVGVFGAIQGDMITIDILEITIDGESALVKTTFHMNMGPEMGEQSQDMTFTMVKEDGDWFINQVA